MRSKPIHIHVEGNGGLAIYDWDGKEFVLREKQNVKAGDLKRIKAVIDENTDIIINRWKEYFAKRRYRKFGSTAATSTDGTSKAASIRSRSSGIRA